MTGATEERTGTVDLGRALGALMRRYLDGAAAAVAELPGGPRGFQVMSIAAAGGCESQAQIAESLGVDRTVMTYLVDDLEKAGMVTRRPDPHDRRARQILLTAKGRGYFEQASARIGDVEREVLGVLSDAESDTFRTLLQRAVSAGPVPDSACEIAETC